MIKSTKVKIILKNTIFPFFTIINKLIPKRDDYILLHSPNLGIQFNLIPLRLYLQEHEYYKNNKIICGIENKKYAEDGFDVTYVTYIKSILYFLRSRHVFYTTGVIPIKPSKKQIVIHLDHGTATFKTGGLLSKIHNGNEFYFTYYTAPSEYYIPIIKKTFKCGEENIVINGEPVNDMLLTPAEKYDLGDYKHIGIWMPTFRQSDYLGYSDSNEQLLPMFMPEDYEELNKVLKKYNIKLYVKLHSMQNIDKSNNFNFSNLTILSEAEMSLCGFKLYPLIQQMDFMIADYSSAFLQYLLLDRPVAFVVPDFDEYRSKRGFVFENPKDFMPGPFITKRQELYDFFSNIYHSLDDYKEKRQKVCSIIHKYKDANNCKRVIDLSEIKNSKMRCKNRKNK
ncbi:MAG: hypothetical protein HFI13_15925 [Lachnospiraceae bacterium]|nr:hypothetical protein [Lachnospiraceae bacterium]